MVVGGLKLKCIQGSGRPLKRAKGADVRERGELQRTESTLAQEDPLLLGMQTSAPGPFRPFKKEKPGDFPNGSVIKDLSCNAGNVGSIPGRGTKIPQGN